MKRLTNFDRPTLWLILIMALATGPYALAQDVLFLKDGKEVQAIVTEITDDMIMYKKYDNQQGPTYSIAKLDVFMIRYENGTKDLFDDDDLKTSEEVPQTDDSKKKSKSEASDLPKGSFNINPLGLIQFGPVFQLELQVGPRTYLAPHFRYAYGGLLTHVVWTGFEDGSELSAGTAAIGLGIKTFAESSGNSWYYGGAFDLGRATARYDVGELSASEEKAVTLSVLSNLGYRWRSSHGAYINVGLFAGLSFDLMAEERRLDNNEIIDETGETTFFGLLELSFGWEF